MENKMPDIVNTREAMVSLANVLAYLFDFLNSIFFIFVILMVVDMFSKVSEALITNSFNLKKSIAFIFMKFGAVLCIILSVLLDYLVIRLSKRLGFNLDTHGVLGIATTCYLIAIEGISILKSLKNLGLQDIPFLNSALTKIKENAKNYGGDSNGDKNS